ncbi:glutamate synthase [Corynebacterium falsenii DSM 44353]|uniref:glutamate synthase large subunit n=1 Tax=Corynebacterium falsenii TaxID=108486 RepID=UPI0003E93E90|nr:glutamate synthase large subunit [Corynebacterium falsenii]AHI02280.1 glutamate synthase [Corynebacterium falsenii DSM 44353]MDC7105002.1 glutamate synthase large subunit [Corynebacterium falsenii]UBI05047.1 glutamate synthase large subunit [Corynebacterium falsenii]
MNNYPARQGLYDPQFEHDACGVAFVVDMHGRASRDIVDKGIQALVNLDHRGAAGAEKNTGDGAGILIQIPDRFYREEMAAQGIELPPAGQYATGIAFLPNSRMAALEAVRDVEQIVKEEGLKLIGWRDVPVDDSSLGAIARDAEPLFHQLFVACDDENGKPLEGLELDRRAWFVRKRAERELGRRGAGSGSGGDTVYFPSLSSRTVVYKGMLTTPQLREFYLDLQDERLESALAIVHSRFSTNTFPSWPLAHPYRMLAHNGEINTVRGNENWMRARESQIHSEILGDLDRVLPICDPDGSDTGRFDEALELLHLGGRSLPHAVLMMVPQAWERNENVDPQVRAFYEFHSTFMEPWDGPAALAFTDGTIIGATLDRNGLRPGRIWITKDGLVVMASEAGVLDIPDSDIVERTRVEPGKMFLVDTARGCVVSDEEIKEKLASRPFQQWVDDNLVRGDELPEAETIEMNHERTVLRQRVFGYTEEDIETLVRPMAAVGAEGIGSMGTDTPIAALSNRPRMLYDFFAQRFAQVTNPPLDSYREKMVTSMFTHLGAQADLLNPGRDAAHRIHLDTPIIRNQLLANLKGLSEYKKYGAFKTVTISGLYPVAHGGRGLSQAIQRVRREVSQAIADGATIVVISDRESNERLAPIPSLLLTSAVHHHMVNEKTRTCASLVVETGDAREVHHMAMLLSFGADAINPYMALQTIHDLAAEGRLGDVDAETGEDNFINAATTGVQKVMSKMGIATVASYRGAQLADVTGLHQNLLDEYFTGAFSPISGMGLEEIAGDVAARHREAFLPRPEEQAHRELEIGGEYKWRREGEYHLFNPETVFKLQHATRTGQYRIFKEYTEKVNNQSERLATLRGLFKFNSNRPPVPIEEVEPVSEIVKRFATGAMSYGSISAEAHETLAIAMNRLKGMSNSGEGGEDPARFEPEANGDWKRSAIKQVASGRFGVTSHYLNNCTDIQIKMAQGAKPGEGGQLPPHKVYPWIAEVRVTTPGVGLISPPPHHDIYSIEDLAQLIHDLKNANPDARIHVKLVAEQGVGTVAAGVSKAHADVVLISGHDGGTGASPLTSLKHAGGPWELGLAETQQTLLMNGLRDRITVQCDGQLKTGRDVVVAALLGAEEFGFATAPLVVTGCIMMRVCHLDTCPVGVATQNPDLRKRYKGQAEHVVNFFKFIAEEVREYLAELGFRSIEEAVGHSECLTGGSMAVEHKTAGKLDLSPIFERPDSPFMFQDLHCTKEQDHSLDKALDNQILADVEDTIREAAKGNDVSITRSYPITNVNRTVGTMTGSLISRVAGREGLAPNTVNLEFTGSAGNSFGAFTTHGMTLTLNGDANDYVGKGLSGGRIIIRPSEDNASGDASTDVIAGNVLGFGGVEGEMFIRGTVGERFCVRNSGLTAVVEGIGNHGCEYMTGGRVIVLGKVGNNFAAGMSGGIAYLLDDGTDVESRINKDLVDIERITDEEELHWVEETIATHRELTGSTVEVDAAKLIKIMPRDYARVLDAIARAEAAGLDKDGVAAAIMEEVN